MLGILKRILHDLSSIPTTIEHWALGLIHAVYSYVNNLFTELRRAANAIHDALVNFEHSIGRFATRIFTFARWIVQHLIPSIVKWAERELHKLLTLANWIIHWITGWIVRLANDIAHAVTSLTKWIISHIWKPLFRDIKIAWHWITHEGHYVWKLITHPDLLVKVLGVYLWKSWLALAKRFAPSMARWIIHSMLAEESRFADVLESILSNML